MGEETLGRLRLGVDGRCSSFTGPFGERQIVFCDWLASSRPYIPLESYINNQVLPYYSNTHTFTSFTGAQSNSFREEARQIIQESTNSNPKLDVVLFTGSGVTSAINKLVSIMKLKERQFTTGDNIPVVFVGPFEHHSNIIPWREAGCNVINIPENSHGTICIATLKELLKMHSSSSTLIGSFSAASNITGIIHNEETTNAITCLMHEFGGYCFWDYATAAPYLKVDMNPIVVSSSNSSSYKDAIFISPHKLLGGVNTPGILILKKSLLDLAGAPSDVSLGGGTVFFVTEKDHRFLSNKTHREEGGTPDIIGSLRAGLAFKLKQEIGDKLISEREQVLWKFVEDQLRAETNIEVLGWDKSPQFQTERLCVLSFLIKCPQLEGRFLHYNFVCALLNDLFGIQSRGGCMCAGPYSQKLLGMNEENIRRIENELVTNPKESELLRPGFTRLSLSYFATKDENEFVINSIKFIAKHGFKLLPLYRMNQETGEFKHKALITKSLQRVWLKDSNLGTSAEFSTNFSDTNSKRFTSVEKLDEARLTFYKESRIFAKDLVQPSNLKRMLANDPISGDNTNIFESESHVSSTELRWFVLPSEAVRCLKSMTPFSEEIKKVVEHVMNPRNYFQKLKNLKQLESDFPSISLPKTKANGKSAEKKVVKQKYALRTAETIRINSSSKQPSNDEQSIEPEASAEACKDGACFVIRKEEKPFVKKQRLDDGKSKEGAKFDYSSEELHFPASEITSCREEASKAKPIKIPKKILRMVGKAVHDWSLIQNGDRLLLGLSGGKDSLALLHLLLHLQKKAPIKFQLACCTIDPLTESFNPGPLIPYLKSLNVEYFYIKSPIFENAKTGSLNNNSICSFCARFKRGLLYNVCVKNNFNKLVLAQHLDDNAESLMMSLFHNGNLSTMKSKYRESTFEKIEIIRPLCYVRENDLKEFSYGAGLPVIYDNCPACFEQPKQRRRMKKLLAREEGYNSNIFNNIRRALIPLMDEKMQKNLKDFTNSKQSIQAQNKKDLKS